MRMKKQTFKNARVCINLQFEKLPLFQLIPNKLVHFAE